ncbi:MAG: glycosyltransferase family 2 protein [bacterium]
MLSPKITFQIVTWNSIKYIGECVESILRQTHREFQILVIDNNSQDGTVKFLKTNYPDITVFQNNKNLGFAKANNQGIRLLNSPYIITCNPDIVLEDNWLENIMAVAESDKYSEYGSFGGKMLKSRIVNADTNELERSNIIDSCGLKIENNFRVVELGAGQDGDAFVSNQEVFGHCAGLALYKREALNDVCLGNQEGTTSECFDEDFFIYKEDIDLAWRLQLFGWKSFLVPMAKAYHVRSLAGSEKRKFMDIFKLRRKQSKISRFYSFRNHWFMLVKNLQAENLKKYWPNILGYEFKKVLYILFLEWSSIKALGQILKLLPKMLAKRKKIMKKARVEARYLRHWIN